MGSKSPRSIIAMARSRITRTLSRRISADWSEVCVTGRRRAEVSTRLPLDNACRMLLLKVVGLVLVVFGASDGDFMVVDVVVISCT
jgi:hypothetical protein